jgi:hypothetical protein
MLNTLSMNSALNSGLKTKILVLFVTKKSRKRTLMHNKELVDSEFFQLSVNILYKNSQLKSERPRLYAS